MLLFSLLHTPTAIHRLTSQPIHRQRHQQQPCESKQRETTTTAATTTTTNIQPSSASPRKTVEWSSSEAEKWELENSPSPRDAKSHRNGWSLISWKGMSSASRTSPSFERNQDSSDWAFNACSRCPTPSSLDSLATDAPGQMPPPLLSRSHPPLSHPHPQAQAQSPAAAKGKSQRLTQLFSPSISRDASWSAQ